MYETNCHFTSPWVFSRSVAIISFLLIAASANGVNTTVERAKDLIAGGKASEAVDILVKETAENPANQNARIVLAEAYEKAGDVEKAQTTWQELLDVTREDEVSRKARHALARLRRVALDKTDIADLSTKIERKDPFIIPMPEVDWNGLEVIEDSKYKPSPYPPPITFELPPFVHETKHFTVYTTNERLAKVVGERAEIYLDFMVQKLFGGRAWAVRFPILVYSSIQDYNSHGGPTGSGGVTYGHISGKTQAIILFQLKPNFRQSARGGGGGGGSELWKYGIESVLPHELTHAVINEFFGGQKTPQWLHEAVAGRFEQTRDHYGEAARLARQVVAGEFFRMRDLFDQEGYPERVDLFYEQAAAVVLYLFEAGPEAMHSFLSELAAGRNHDAACAAALGIPEKDAVEEFERRWVEWMRVRYVKDLDNAKDKTVESSAQKTVDAASLPWVNEVETANSVSNWREIDLASQQSFQPIGEAKDTWSVKDGILSYQPASGGSRGTLLGIRMNEAAPAAMSFDVKTPGSPGETRLIGVAQVDADGFDTRVEVLAPLRDSASHNVLVIWSDDLSIYVDGICAGRFAAMQIGGNAQDVDFPLALVADGPVEVQKLKVAAIKTFSDKPVVAQVEEKKGDSATEQQEQPSNSRRRRRGEASKP